MPETSLEAGERIDSEDAGPEKEGHSVDRAASVNWRAPTKEK